MLMTPKPTSQQRPTLLRMVVEAHAEHLKRKEQADLDAMARLCRAQ